VHDQTDDPPAASSSHAETWPPADLDRFLALLSQALCAHDAAAVADAARGARVAIEVYRRAAGNQANAERVDLTTVELLLSHAESLHMSPAQPPACVGDLAREPGTGSAAVPFTPAAE